MFEIEIYRIIKVLRFFFIIGTVTTLKEYSVEIRNISFFPTRTSFSIVNYLASADNSFESVIDTLL